MNTKLFRHFQYPTVPLGVCDEYRNRLLRRALGRHPELWQSR
jgi:hypothetical protein